MRIAILLTGLLTRKLVDVRKSSGAQGVHQYNAMFEQYNKIKQHIPFKILLNEFFRFDLTAFHIINAYKKHDVCVFIVVSDTYVDNIYSNIIRDKLFYEDRFKNKLKGFLVIKDDNKHLKNPSFFYQFNKLKLCFDMASKYMSDNNTNFDMFIRHRTDGITIHDNIYNTCLFNYNKSQLIHPIIPDKKICIKKIFDDMYITNDFRLPNVIKNTIYVPGVNKKRILNNKMILQKFTYPNKIDLNDFYEKYKKCTLEYLFDHFAIGDYESMKIYCDVINNLRDPDPKYIKNGTINEMQLLRHLKHNNVNITRVMEWMHVHY
jgi:hypothetical protein